MLPFLNEIGDTSLPPGRPEMLNDDLLKQLHYVLLKSVHTPYFPSHSRLTMSFVDPHRQRFDDMSKLRARLSHFERDPKYGPHLPFSLPCQFSHFTPSPSLQFLAEHEIE